LRFTNLHASEGRPVGVVEFHDRAATVFDARLGEVRPDQWDQPTPCDLWTVRALVEHVVGNHQRMAQLLHGAGNVANVPGEDLVAAWREARSAVRDGLAEPSALEREVPSPFGGMIALKALLRILTTDLTAHTWDLARSIGADERLDPEVVAAIYPGVQAGLPTLQASGMFAPSVDVSPDAEPQVRLLALLGRRAG
jgi:uncharacterized protein (TIGR03086 family)